MAESIPNLCDESFRLLQKIDLDKFNIINMLAKRDRMSDTVKNIIIDTTHRYVEKCLTLRNSR